MIILIGNNYVNLRVNQQTVPYNLQMKLHIFNPEHDLALAADLANFTPPKAAMKLRKGLGFIPALWAGSGDAVLVDEPSVAIAALSEAAKAIGRPLPDVSFVTKNSLSRLKPDAVCPWGWDRALYHDLLRNGIPSDICPSERAICTIRALSHRRTAAALLSQLRLDGTVGEAYECNSEAQIVDFVQSHNHAVIKAPWSSSGRGVRMINGAEIDHGFRGWIKNLLKQQGALMVEPYYEKVKDFGMEFICDGQGGVTYLGLSLFEADGSAYTGNLLATESFKLQAILTYISAELYNAVKKRIQTCLADMLGSEYAGPLGIDMMIVKGNASHAFMLHPCVEINLRRTMGHVALSLMPTDETIQMTMRIETDNNYKLKIQ